MDMQRVSSGMHTDEIVDLLGVISHPPHRPDGVGVTSAEYAKRIMCSTRNARDSLYKVKELLGVTMMCEERRTVVFIPKQDVLENEHWRLWTKETI